ncbi:MAG: glycosyltransferase family 2 protein [Bacteroidetes bacterium]|nr:glycosyltransferase family 2 protein [Bacteroidota bacterium]
MEKKYYFPDVSLLVTHYNRSQSLERLLKSFEDLHVSFGGIVVSDDGSKQEHLDYIKKLQETRDFKLVTTEKNKGLGNNINKGQNAITTPYTLYVQEDFVPLPIFPQHFADGKDIIDDRNDIDMVRFYAYFDYPYKKNIRNGYSEMIFSIWKPGYHKFYMYSDHPHLRRTDFFKKFGPYVEGRKVEETEFMMMMSFINKKGKAVIYEGIKDLFDQKNSSVEPSTVKRNFWREGNGFVLKQMRNLWRTLKFNTYYFFGR